MLECKHEKLRDTNQNRNCKPHPNCTTMLRLVFAATSELLRLIRHPLHCIVSTACNCDATQLGKNKTTLSAPMESCPQVIIRSMSSKEPPYPDIPEPASFLVATTTPPRQGLQRRWDSSAFCSHAERRTEQFLDMNVPWNKGKPSNREQTTKAL